MGNNCQSVAHDVAPHSNYRARLAEQVQSTHARKAGVGWIIDQAIEHWPVLALSLSGAAGGVLAALTSWLHAYGPIAWGGAAIVGAGAAAVIYWLFMKAKVMSASADYDRAMATVPVTVNPLKSSFENERVRLSVFFSAHAVVRTSKTFRNCEIYGPGALVVLEDCTLRGCGFTQCDLVALPERTPVYTAVGFRRTAFEDCKFFNVTMFFPLPVCQKIVEDSLRQGHQAPQIIGYAPDDPSTIT